LKAGRRHLHSNDLCDSRGLIVTDREEGITIREFREKIKLEKEITEIDAELAKQAAALNQIEDSRSSVGQVQQALLYKRDSACSP
jgi:hypothetical protein